MTRASSTLMAMARQLCPRCHEGRVWAGIITMNEHCPSCGLRFEREPGYFTGAMLASYAIGVPVLGLLLLVIWLLTRWSFEWVFALAMVAYLALTPAIFRYSRVAWMHLDRRLDPEDR